MTFDIKTTLLVTGYIVTCVSFLFAFIYKVKNVEKEHAALKKIIFLEKGGLNIVTIGSCRESRIKINRDIRRESGITKEALEQIKCLSDNVIIIMTKMELEPKIVPGKSQKVFKSLIPEKGVS